MADKHSIVKALAKFQAQLLDGSLQGMGNIYSTSESPELGPMVATAFFRADGGQTEMHRGPFRSGFEWLTARLDMVCEEQLQLLEHADDEDVIEDAKISKSLAEQLRCILPTMFDQNSEPESSSIFHESLSMSNILVDDTKRPFIIDWECVSALPLWRACQFPEFLVGPIRTEAPIADHPIRKTKSTGKCFWRTNAVTFGAYLRQRWRNFGQGGFMTIAKE